MASYYGGIVVDIAEEGLERVIKILAGVPGGYQRAVGSAIKRAASTALTFAKREITKEYTLSSGVFLRRTRNINHFTHGGMGVEIGFRGAAIPLAQFSFQASKNGGVKVNVKKSTGVKSLDHAFLATAYSHTGIWERVGRSRFPIHELFGPATPQMMYSNEDVADGIEDKLAETYLKRIDHEIARILCGWG